MAEVKQGTARQYRYKSVTVQPAPFVKLHYVLIVTDATVLLRKGTQLI
ncbi:hypothetical protein RUMHYD_02927 [Blautia hydrogenotrophica DSM 10507]|uniref:Uncharacterized protein n=1 Tax=Blautia hydrogenotrophica (strain DSM 10507 / JCM 14656 / S5a33) TaxID=476272 RepID=C0CPX5_BLAHS|nr:hypothetical protein RUMHYD_02927 [Blautia hydrogenotrophica DSM 10507]